MSICEGPFAKQKNCPNEMFSSLQYKPAEMMSNQVASEELDRTDLLQSANRRRNTGRGHWYPSQGMCLTTSQVIYGHCWHVIRVSSDIDRQYIDGLEISFNICVCYGPTSPTSGGVPARDCSGSGDVRQLGKDPGVQSSSCPLLLYPWPIRTCDRRQRSLEERRMARDINIRESFIVNRDVCLWGRDSKKFQIINFLEGPPRIAIYPQTINLTKSH